MVRYGWIRNRNTVDKQKRIAFCAAAVENTRPVMLLEKVKVGSVIYMVPTPITEHR